MSISFIAEAQIEMCNDGNKIAEHKHLTDRVNSTISSEQWLEMPRLRRAYN